MDTHLGFWFDGQICKKDKNMNELMTSFYRNKAYYPEAFISSLSNCDAVIYMHSPASTFKPLDAVYHCVLRFITGDGFRTHCYSLYEKVGWHLLAVRRIDPAASYLYIKHFLENFGISLIVLTVDQ